MNPRPVPPPRAPGGSDLAVVERLLVSYRPLARNFRPRERAGQPTGQPRAVMDDEQRSAKTDEASDHEPDKEDESCCDVFPFMQLPDDMRARALEYLLSASEA